MYILKELFGRIYIPGEVYEEVAIKGKGKVGAREIKFAIWIEKKEIKNTQTCNRLIREFSLGKGEAEAIVLGKEMHADLVLLDEGKARDIAVSLGLKVRGTLGILARWCYREGRIEKFPSLVDELRRKGVRFSKQIYEEIKGSFK
ncbi:MAG TPA: DUF3368 domain-containing protein [Elusimicrobia bacterium]|nr:DUF3368 domain-containing protein [Elusimicrobiota bacterium]